MNVKWALSRNAPVDIDLNDVCSGTVETHVREECDIVRIPIVFDRELRRYGNNDFFSVGTQDLYLCLELAFPDPVIHDCELQQSGWKSLKENVFENPHQ